MLVSAWCRFVEDQISSMLTHSDEAIGDILGNDHMLKQLYELGYVSPTDEQTVQSVKQYLFKVRLRLKEQNQHEYAKKKQETGGNEMMPDQLWIDMVNTVKEYKGNYDKIMSVISRDWDDDMLKKHDTQLRRLVELATKVDHAKLNLELSVEYMITRGLYFVHLKMQGEKEQWNLKVWDAKRYVWDTDAANIIHDYLEVLKRVNGYVLTPELAARVAKVLSSRKDTLHVYLDDAEYKRQRITRIIGPKGKYDDLKTGEIRQVHPATDYFESVDVMYDFDENCKDPAEFVAMLKDRFGESWEVVRDHLAGTFLENSILGSKPKMLIICGGKNTYKSFLLEIISGLFVDTAKSNVAPDKLDDDAVFGPATVINRFLNYSEEMAPKLPKNQSTIKDMITKIGGSARRMRSTQAIPAMRWPRCNYSRPIKCLKN